MITHETLKEWLENCQASLQETITAQGAAVKSVRDLEVQRAHFEGQIYILEKQMDIENNPPTVELPFAKEKIQELYDQRLSDHAEKREEVYQGRQEKTYKREAMDTAHQIDHVNRLEKEEDNLSEGDS